MSDIKIQDTGKYSTTSSLISGEARAYGDSGIGTSLTLKGAEVTFSINPMTTADSPLLKKKNNLSTGYFQFGESDTVGVQLPTWTVRGYLNRTIENDMIVLGRLIFMCMTKGYKILYSSNSSDFHDIIAYSHYGEREFNGETTKTISSINVRIRGMSLGQTADKKGFFYTINLVETN
jgi:hypothetical protein